MVDLTIPAPGVSPLPLGFLSGLAADLGALSAQLDAAQSQVDRHLALAAEEAKSATAFWRQVCEYVAENGSERGMALRGPWVKRVNAVLAGLDQMEQLVNGELARRSGLRFDGLAAMRAAGDELRQLADHVLPRWNTAEDLAMLAVETLSIPQARLEELARLNPAPQEWFDEEWADRPF